MDAARVTAAISNRNDSDRQALQAVERLSAALSSLEPDTASPAVVAQLEERSARAYIYAGRGQEAAEPIERALALAQHHELIETYVLALQIKAYLYTTAGRVEEGILNLEGSLEVARKHDLVEAETRSQTSHGLVHDLRPAGSRGARSFRPGDRPAPGARGQEVSTLGNLMYVLMMAGRWDESTRLATEVFELAAGEDSVNTSLIHYRQAFLEALRGEVEAPENTLHAASPGGTATTSRTTPCTGAARARCTRRR